ncbi:hypothetical protein RJ40_05570 [Methanofollis aquaemaris]|uniref:Uncharacterized protein n=1 Tax=Methanofollis aquaemaris TaxID=126734 RepID=A0A8A3S5M1_9EURY|nr:hypothetical protein RJ40_05570 [Methanofollis aquaemaris]
MSSELTEETLFILNLLYKRRSVRSDRGYHSEMLKKLYLKKFPGRDHLSFKKALKILLNEGYITKIAKKEDKYYISNISKAVSALENHGYSASKGL